jgi:hypothetical protein
MQQDPYVEVGILYELRNNYWSGDADNWEDQLGLMTTGWSHKPAYDAFRAVDPNQGGCTYHDLHGTPLGPGTELAQPSAPAQAPAAASSGSKKSSEAPTIVLRVKTASQPQDEASQPQDEASKLHAAGSFKRLKSGVRFNVFGRVVGSKGGRIVLTFQHRVNGKWRKAYRRALTVKRDGSFKSPRLKALNKGGWRVQATYAPSAQPAKSRFVYFKV